MLWWLKKYFFEPLATLFLFTICWWTVFVISLIKRTWGSCSQCRFAKYHISKNQSPLGFTCILSAVICSFQGNQLIHIIFPVQAALNLDDMRYCIWDLYRLGQKNFSDMQLHSFSCSRAIYQCSDLSCYNQMLTWKVNC